MNEMFSQGGKGSTGILTNKQAVARHFGVKQSEVVYFSVGASLGGYKVIYDKESQRAYTLPPGYGASTTMVSLSPAGVLVHSDGNDDLGLLAVTRKEYVVVTDTFTTGSTLRVANELLTHNGNQYRWAGPLPKTVPANSTPDSTGGIGTNAWVNLSTISTENIVYGGMGLNQYLSSLALPSIEEFRQPGFTDAQTLQAALNAGSVRIPSGSLINITDGTEISIPSDRTILVEVDAILRSNGRLCGIGSNNIKWLILGKVQCPSMTPAPAKTGIPNTAAGTQAGDERGFIEFGGTVFAGNDGKDYLVNGFGVGEVNGYWTGTPNVSDLTNQLNKKGIAAWNCSNFVVKDIKINGFEGEQVYWFSRNANNRDLEFSGITSTDARFNALNSNVYNAMFNIVIRDCYTKNSYNGIESSAGDIINTTHDGCVNAGILFGLGSGGGNRLLANNSVNDCLGTPYSLLYNKDYEGRGYIPNVTIVNNTATNPGNHFITASGIAGLRIHGNTCYGLKTGRFIQATFIQGGEISGNTNYKPEPGTEHIYRGEVDSLIIRNNPKVTLGGSHITAAASAHDVQGGLLGSITTFGNRENFEDYRTDSPSLGSGAEIRFSYDVGINFSPVSLSANLNSYDSTGATADFSVNNLKINASDVLGQSWVFKSNGYLQPGTDGTQDLGSAGKRLNNSFFTVAPTVTSNEFYKTTLLSASEAEKAAAIEIKANISKYKLLDAVAIKGENSARWHFGVGAQTVGSILAKHGLNPEEYGFWCHDKWDDTYEPIIKKSYTGKFISDESGHMIPEIVYEDTGEKRLVRKAGENFGIRYDELAMFILCSI